MPNLLQLAYPAQIVEFKAWFLGWWFLVSARKRNFDSQSHFTVKDSY